MAGRRLIKPTQPAYRLPAHTHSPSALKYNDPGYGYAGVAPLSERQYLLSIAASKKKPLDERSPKERMQLKAKPGLSALRALDKKEAKKIVKMGSNDC